MSDEKQSIWVLTVRSLRHSSVIQPCTILGHRNMPVNLQSISVFATPERIFHSASSLEASQCTLNCCSLTNRPWKRSQRGKHSLQADPQSHPGERVAGRIPCKWVRRPSRPSRLLGENGRQSGTGRFHEMGQKCLSSDGGGCPRLVGSRQLV